jgi:hypothetical protein
LNLGGEILSMQMNIEDTNMHLKLEQPINLIETGIKKNGNNIRPKSYVVHNKIHLPNKLKSLVIMILKDFHTKVCMIFL